MNRSHGTSALHPSKDLLRRFINDIAPAPQLRMPNEQYEELVTVCYYVLCTLWYWQDELVGVWPCLLRNYPKLALSKRQVAD